MRVVLDASVIANPLTGIARYAFELASSMTLCGADVEYWTWERLGSALRQKLGAGPTVRTFPHLRGAGTALIPSVMCRRHGVDVFHFPNGDLLRCPVPATSMIHDLTPFIFDDILPAELAGFYRERTRRVVKRCGAIFVNSQTTLDDLERFFPEGRERYFLTHLGSDHPLAEPEPADRPPFGLEPGYLLAVGTIEPRKNYGTLLRAYAALSGRRPGHLPRLVICGGDGYRAGEIRRLSIDLGLRETVTFTGYAGEGELASLYGHACAFVHPALYEGFGFPIVEAVRRGLPVAASDNSSVRELFEGLFLPFDAGSVESAAEAIEALPGTPLDAQGEEIRRMVLERLTWRNCAERTLAVMRDL